MSTQVTNEKVDKKYYLVLAEVSIFQTVWLIPREDGSIGWTDEIKQAKPFLSYEEAQNKTEAHMQSVFEFIASYKIIEFSIEELDDFLIATS